MGTKTKNERRKNTRLTLFISSTPHLAGSDHLPVELHSTPINISSSAAPTIQNEFLDKQRHPLTSQSCDEASLRKRSNILPSPSSKLRTVPSRTVLDSPKGGMRRNHCVHHHSCHFTTHGVTTTSTSYQPQSGMVGMANCGILGAV
eukprot:scaffold9770_cov77-Skeletonema_marinoi.AAC.2